MEEKAFRIVKVKDTIREQRPYNIRYTGFKAPDIPFLGLKSDVPILDDVYIINPVGFTSTPDTNDDAYIFQGMMGEKCCIATDIYSKPETKPNEVCIGNFKTFNYVRINDNQIKIEEDGTDEIYTKTTKKTSINSNDIIELRAEKKIVIVAPDVEITGNLTISGNLTVTGMINASQGMTVNGKVINDVHSHSGGTINGNTGGVN